MGTPLSRRHKLQILEKLIGLQNEALKLVKTCKKESKVSSAV
jgi:hypothetical protein